MAQCVFVSFFNSNNIGDRLIADMLTASLEKNGLKVQKASYEGSFSITHKKLIRDGDTLVYYLNRFIKKLNNIIFWIQYDKKIKEVDLLVVGGGNMIMDLSIDSKAWYFFERYIKIARKHKKKVVILSIGIGPFQSKLQQENAAKVLALCDYVTYRDDDSFTLGKGRGDKNQFVSIDPVFMMPKVIKEDKDAGRTIGIGVINSYLFNNNPEKYIEVINGYKDLIDKLLKNKYKIVIFSTEKDDFNIIKDLSNKFERNKVEVKYITTIDKLLCLYNKLSYVVAARMHSLIIAYTQDVPIIGLSWQQKIDSMFDIIQKKENCIKLDELETNVDYIIDKINSDLINQDFFNNKAAIYQEFNKKYEKNDYVIKKALGNTENR